MENRYGPGYFDRPHEAAEVQDFSEKVVWNVINRLNQPLGNIFERSVGEDMRRIMIDEPQSLKVEISIESRLEPNYSSPQEDELVYEAVFSIEEKQDDEIGETLVGAAYELYEKERAEWEQKQSELEDDEDEDDELDEEDEYDEYEPEWDATIMNMAVPWLVKTYTFERRINRLSGEYEDSYAGGTVSCQLQGDAGQTLFDDRRLFSQTGAEVMAEGSTVEVSIDFDNLTATSFSAVESTHIVNALCQVGIPAAWMADWTGNT